MKNFLSLGESCQTSYQIRRRTNSTERYIFDWIISDIDVVAKVLTDFNENEFLHRTNIQLADSGVRLRDVSTGLRFQHDFKLNSEGLHTIDIADEELHRIKEKYIYLREKTIKYIQGNKVIPIYYDWRRRGNKFCTEVLDRLADLDTVDFSGRIIVSSEALVETQYLGKGILYKLEEPRVSVQKHRWRGDDLCWDKLFDDCENRSI